MLVYIVHLRNHSEFEGVFTDLPTAKKACYKRNLHDLVRYWDISQIELTTDKFMKTVLKDN